jgi:hypothetical protein
VHTSGLKCFVLTFKEVHNRHEGDFVRLRERIPLAEIKPTANWHKQKNILFIDGYLENLSSSKEKFGT